MKKVFFVALAIAGFFFFSSCEKSQEYKEKQQKEKAELGQKVEAKKQLKAKEKKAKDELRKKHLDTLFKLVKKHNAMTPKEWRPKGNSKEVGIKSEVSLDYNLVNDEGRPAIVTGAIADAYRSNGKYFLKLTTGPSHPFFSRSMFQSYIDFYLECSKEIVQKAMKMDRGNLGVVAKFHEFKKIDFIYRGEKTDDTVEIQTRKSQSYIANGTCIDVLVLPEEKKEEPTPEERLEELNNKLKNN
jgi:hypothetical protein